MYNYFILLAAGSGKRFKSSIPKQYTFYKQKQLLVHSIDKAIKSRLFKKIILVSFQYKFIISIYDSMTVSRLCH